MQIRSIELRNFRCVKEATLTCTRFTSMVGSNGVGKSTFLRALELFYEPSPRVGIDDYYGTDPSVELVVAVTYEELSSEARALFAKYMQGDAVTIERVFSAQSSKVSGRYHGAMLRQPAFRTVRDGLLVKDRGKTAKVAYEQLRQQAGFSSLAEWTTLGDVPDALAAWETANTHECVRDRDDGQFFGFTEVAQGYLGRFTRLIYIPAVRDASTDAAESRGSVLSSLMDLVVRSALTNKDAYRRLQSRSQVLYDRMMSPARLGELATLGSNLSATLQVYVPDAAVTLNWRPLGAIDFPMPTADIKLLEGDYESAVDRTGHGLQRAFILTMLQQLSRVRPSPSSSGSEDVTSLPSLVLAIEKPELYQHPSRQRHLSKILAKLAGGGIEGVTQATQIICGTHSPLFVSIERIAELRLLRRESVPDGKPKTTRVVSTDLNRLAEAIWEADGKPGTKYTGASLLPRLKPLMTPWVNEGFFAEVVVLVEGEDDRAALLGTAQALGIDFDAHSFAILPCGGKTCLDRPYAIFTQLGIPTYVVWDGDKGDKEARPEDNHRLLRLLGSTVKDWPNDINGKFGCFEADLETTMSIEIGREVYDATLSECQIEFMIPKRKHAMKNATVVASLIERASKKGRQCESLERIVQSIQALR